MMNRSIAVAQADLHHRRVVADAAFGDHVRPPAEHGVEHQHQPDQRRATARDPWNQSTAPNSITMAPTAPVSGQMLGAQDVVVVVLVAGHGWLPSTARSSRRRPVPPPAAAGRRGSRVLGQVRPVHGVGQRDRADRCPPRRSSTIAGIDVEADRHLHPSRPGRSTCMFEAEAGDLGEVAAGRIRRDVVARPAGDRLVGRVVGLVERQARSRPAESASSAASAGTPRACRARCWRRSAR